MVSGSLFPVSGSRRFDKRDSLEMELGWFVNERFCDLVAGAWGKFEGGCKCDVDGPGREEGHELASEVGINRI